MSVCLCVCHILFMVRVLYVLQDIQHHSIIVCIIVYIQQFMSLPSNILAVVSAVALLSYLPLSLSS